ncbi:MAG: hypothetical protein ACTHO8_11890 [Solirubrobacterales bacterium]
MGAGRRAAAVAGLIGALALLAGCGESRHANEQRPSPPTRVSVTINPKQVLVQPVSVATGPEKTQQIPQNQNHPQPPIRTKIPLNVVFVIANQTDTETQLKISGTKQAESSLVYGHSPGTYQADLPTGTYTITAVNMPESRAGHLKVGSFRASSQNDVLLP